MMMRDPFGGLHYRGSLPGPVGIFRVETPFGPVTGESTDLSAFEAQAGHIIAAYLTRVEGRKAVAISTHKIIRSIVFRGDDDKPAATMPGTVMPFRPRVVE